MSDHTRDPEVEALLRNLQGEIEAEIPFPRPVGEVLNILRRAIQAGVEQGERRGAKNLSDLLRLDVLKTAMAERNAKSERVIADAVRAENEACAEAVAAFTRGLPEGPGPQVIVRQLIDAAEAAIRARRKP